MEITLQIPSNKDNSQRRLLRFRNFSPFSQVVVMIQKLNLSLRMRSIV